MRHIKTIFTLFLTSVVSIATAENLYMHTSNGKWGFVDENNKVVIPAIYEEVEDFYNGNTPVKKNGKWGIIDTKGNFIIQPRYNYLGYLNEGLVPVLINGKWGCINKKNEIVIKPRFDCVWGCITEGVLPAKLDGKFGFYDKKGDLLIKRQFCQADGFSDGFAAVAPSSDKKFGYIDKTGKIVIKPQFKYASSFVKGLAPVEKSDKTGFINKSGKFVVEPTFDIALPFNDGYSLVVINEKIGFIDTNGQYLVKPKFDNATIFSNGCAFVKLDKKWYKLDKNGKMRPHEVFADILKNIPASRIERMTDSDVKIYALMGKVEAQRQLASVYLNKGDYKRSTYWYEKASSQGHLRARCFLAAHYLYGKGVKVDIDKAKWLYEHSDLDYCRKENQTHIIHLATRFIDKSETRKAEELIYKIYGRKLDDPYIKGSLSEEYWFLQNYWKTNQLLKELLKDKPHDPDLLHRLGTTYYQLKDKQNALKAFNDCLKYSKNKELSEHTKHLIEQVHKNGDHFKKTDILP